MFTLFAINKAKNSFFSPSHFTNSFYFKDNWLHLVINDKLLNRIDFRDGLVTTWTMILNNHTFNLYIRSSMSHLGPCYRPVLQMGGRGKWRTYRVKQHCSPTYASAKRAREIDACSLDSRNQFLYSSFGSEQHICVILHKYAAQGWVPFMGYCPTQSHFLCVRACGDSDPTAGLAQQRPPSHCRVTKSADESSWQLLHPY